MIKNSKACYFAAVLALICAILSMSGCRITGDSDDDDFVGPQKPRNGGSAIYASGMSLTYKDSESGANLIAFKREKNGYSYDVKREEAKTYFGGKFVVSIVPENPATVIGWIIKDTTIKGSVEGSPAVYSAEVNVPVENDAGFEIIATLTIGSNSAVYSITITPPQSKSYENYYLKLLEVRYTDYCDTSNQIVNFSPFAPYYAFSLSEDGIAYAHVRAVAMSEMAKVTISYNGVDAVTQIGSAEKDIALPLKNGQSSVLTIKVTNASNNGHTEYEVEIDPFAADIDTWSGNVANKLAGKTESDGKIIVSVIARDANMNKKPLKLAAQNKDSSDWTLSVAKVQNYVPVSFIVFLTSVDNNFVSQDIKPNIPESKTNIQLDVIAAGIRIVDANEFEQLGEAANQNEDFALGSDIDLSDKSGAWRGTNGDYKGSFYGNGYTIKGLVLDKTGGDLGLFTGLDNNAIIENFTLQVSTANSNPRTSDSHFGGVAGYLHNSVTLKNIKVTGSLNYGPINKDYYILAGALAGEIDHKSTVTIENCASELNITLAGGSGSGLGELGFGGLVGKTYSSLTIRNSYATGNIEVTHGGNKHLWVGGLVGQCRDYGTITIENSYASGNVVAKRTDSGFSRWVIAGGLVGRKNGGSTIIKNSAALNKKVVALTGVSNGYSERLLGRLESSTTTYTNNFALEDMFTGTTDGDYPAATVTVGSPNTATGYGKSAGEFKQRYIWDELGFDDAIWNLDDLSSGAPKLR